MPKRGVFCDDTKFGGHSALYRPEDREQLFIEDFYLPFGGKLRKENRWVQIGEITLWTYIEEIYEQKLSRETGRPALSARPEILLKTCQKQEKDQSKMSKSKRRAVEVSRAGGQTIGCAQRPSVRF